MHALIKIVLYVINKVRLYLENILFFAKGTAMKILARTAITFPEYQEIGFEDVAREAQELLGYQVPTEELVHANAENRQRHALHMAMRTLDIRPFCQKDVDRYKAKMVRRHMLMKSRASLFVWKAREVFFLVFACAFVISIVVHPLAYFLGWHASWALLSIGGSFSGLVMSLIFGVMVQHILADKLGNITLLLPKWEVESLQDYKSAVPEFVLQSAIDLKKACPEVRFFVESLQWQKVTLDPFLVVEYADLRYHIEVWNEPGFQQKRLM